MQLTAVKGSSLSRCERRGASVQQQQRDKLRCVAVSQLSMAADWIQTLSGL